MRLITVMAFSAWAAQQRFTCWTRLNQRWPSGINEQPEKMQMDEDEFEEHPADDMSQYQDYPYDYDY